MYLLSIMYQNYYLRSYGRYARTCLTLSLIAELLFQRESLPLFPDNPLFQYNAFAFSYLQFNKVCSVCLQSLFNILLFLYLPRSGLERLKFFLLDIYLLGFRVFFIFYWVVKYFFLHTEGWPPPLLLAEMADTNSFWGLPLLWFWRLFHDNK